MSSEKEIEVVAESNRLIKARLIKIRIEDMECLHLYLINEDDSSCVFKQIRPGAATLFERWCKTGTTKKSRYGNGEG